MKEFKGTKGKWEVKPSISKTAYNVVGTIPGEKYKIARCPYIRDEECNIAWNELERKESLANANLIAASPEMLDLLLKVKESINKMDYASIEALYCDIEETTDKALGING